jgi:hypothetical protein
MKASFRDFALVGAGMLVGAVALGRAWAQVPNAAAQQQQQIVTTTPARQTPGAPLPGVRYQYMCQTKWEPRLYDGEVQRRINELGAQGWHLMAPMIARAPGFNYADVYCFERAY